MFHFYNEDYLGNENEEFNLVYEGDEEDFELDFYQMPDEFKELDSKFLFWAYWEIN